MNAKGIRTACGISAAVIAMTGWVAAGCTLLGSDGWHVAVGGAMLVAFFGGIFVYIAHISS